MMEWELPGSALKVETPVTATVTGGLEVFSCHNISEEASKLYPKLLNIRKGTSATITT
jgi:hypothetical protein